MASFRESAIVFFGLLASALWAATTAPAGKELNQGELTHVIAGAGDCQHSVSGPEACKVCIVDAGYGKKCKVSVAQENCSPNDPGPCSRCEELSPNPTCPGKYDLYYPGGQCTTIMTVDAGDCTLTHIETYDTQCQNTDDCPH